MYVVGSTWFEASWGFVRVCVCCHVVRSQGCCAGVPLAGARARGVCEEGVWVQYMHVRHTFALVRHFQGDGGCCVGTGTPQGPWVSLQERAQASQTCAAARLAQVRRSWSNLLHGMHVTCVCVCASEEHVNTVGVCTEEGW